MLAIYTKMNSLLDEEGQTVVEYCIMVGVVALAIIALNPSITNAVSSFFNRVSTQLGSLS